MTEKKKTPLGKINLKKTPYAPPKSQTVDTNTKAENGVWVASTYFAEGFPYAIVHTFAEVIFKSYGASLATIGLTSLFHLPWNLKFLWGPFLDGFATKRKWMLWLESAIVAVIVLMAFATTLPNILTVISVLFVILAFLSATHDIAIDGYYLEALNTEDQSRYVGFRASAYRIAMFVVGGPLLIAIGYIGWFAGIGLTALIMLAILFLHSRILPHVETERKTFSDLLRKLQNTRSILLGSGIALVIVAIREIALSQRYSDLLATIYQAQPWLEKLSVSSWIAIVLLSSLFAMLAMLPWAKKRFQNNDSFYAKAYIQFLEQPKVGAILAFIILFRTGESFLTKMRFAFLNDIGMSVEEYGFAFGTIGIGAAFVSTLIGGWLIAKHGLYKWIWPMVLAQNLLNLLFMGLAHYVEHFNPLVSNWILTTIIGVEAFGSGLGTAVFMVYIMRCCRSEYRAAHMAILTALMSLSFTIAGVLSGFLAQSWGYTTYFGFTFLATIPGMLLLFIVPYLHGDSADDACAINSR